MLYCLRKSPFSRPVGLGKLSQRALQFCRGISVSRLGCGVGGRWLFVLMQNSERPSKVTDSPLENLEFGQN